MQPPLPNPQQGGPQYGPPQYAGSGYDPTGNGPQGSGPQGGGPLTAEERNWAMGCHLAAFAGYLGVPFGHILGPLLVWTIKRDTSAFINEHGKEAMNYNISISIYAAICIAVGFTIVGLLIAIPAGIALAIADVVFRIIASLKASNGEKYAYPMTIRFLN